MKRVFMNDLCMLNTVIFIDIFQAKKHVLNCPSSRMLRLKRKCCCMRFQGKLYHCRFEFFSSCFFDAKLVWCSRALNNIRVFTVCVKYFPSCTQSCSGDCFPERQHISLFCVVISQVQY